MTTWHDPDMLIDHLRHSFVIADETAACEAVLQPPIIRSKPGGVVLPVSADQRSPRFRNRSSASSGEADSSELDGSELLQWDKLSRDLRKQDSTPYRNRSKTFARLEVERAKKQRVPVRLVSPNPVPQNDSSNLFLCLNDSQYLGTQRKRNGQSLASQILLRSASEAKNPFKFYSKFDADSNPGISSRKLRIFVAHASLNVESVDGINFQVSASDSADKPHRHAGVSTSLDIAVESGAKVSDVIGLICYHYVAKKLEPRMPDPAPKFSLYMADEGGEAEIDLPPLDARDRIAKYGFSSLAMVKRDDVVEDETVRVAVHADIGEPLLLDLDGESLTLKFIRDTAQQHFYPAHSATLLGYNLEDFSVPGRALPLDVQLKSLTARTFYLIRKNCSRAYTSGRSLTRATTVHAVARSVSPMELNSSVHNEQQSSYPGSVTLKPLKVNPGHSKAASVSGPIATTTYFPVMALSRFKIPTAVQLGICPEQIEVVPSASQRKASATTRFLRGLSSGQSSVHTINDVGACEVLTSAKGRSTFKIHYKTPSGEWKAYHFESDASHLATIARKLARYAARANSAAWAEYSRRHSPSTRKISVMSRLVKDAPRTTFSSGGDPAQVALATSDNR